MELKIYYKLVQIDKYDSLREHTQISSVDHRLLNYFSNPTVFSVKIQPWSITQHFLQ